MRTKWLMVLAVILFLLTWTSVFAGPKGEVGRGDDDIPELTRPRANVSIEKILDSLEVESLWNAAFRVDLEKQPEPGRLLDAKSVRVPAARRYPVRFK